MLEYRFLENMAFIGGYSIFDFGNNDKLNEYLKARLK
jgi:hypothetical protein